MKQHTTNYHNTLIQVAKDCPANRGEVPPVRGKKKTIANHQFDLIYEHPYEYTSDEVIFTVFALRNDIPESDWNTARKKFFSKGQACLRTSPLAKRYGWGIHSNAAGKVALVGMDTKEYQSFVSNPEVTKTKAMRSSR